MRAMIDFSLASAFPPASEAEWRAIAGKALKGASFAALQTRLYEGVTTEPLYTGRGRYPAIHGNRGWLIIQPLAGEKQAADDLAGGANAFSLDFDACPGIETKNDLQACLRAGSVFLAPGAAAADAALLLAAKGDALGLQGSAGFDPLTAFALSGELPADRSSLFSDTVDAAFHIRERCPSFVPFLASGGAWNGAGGSATEELGFTLAAGVAYWRALAEAGMPAGEAARCIGFSLTASSDIFIAIAAFRAMRLLWARALSAAGESQNPGLLLLARMSPRILSAYDPHVNLLRATAAAFGAGAGGATGIEILPFDSVSGGANEFSLKLARNISLVLQHEAWLPAVADPAAGSSYVEALTEGLSAAAWRLFQEVEAQGGLAAALENGFVAGKLRLPWEAQTRAIARRGEKITGVSVFPNLAEAAPAFETVAARAEGGARAAPELTLPPAGKGERFAALLAAASSGTSLADLRAASGAVNDLAFTPLERKRDAEPFEALRQRADIALLCIGSRPPLFLALLGKPDEYRARANWVQSFFAAGGVEVLVPEQAFDSLETLAEAFKQSPAPVACICASNGVYASTPGAAAALKRSGAVLVYLAGPPSILKTLDAADRGAIDRLVYEGCNALALLQETQQVLRVEELSEAAGLEAVDEGFEVYAEVEASSY
jgi:methylmalonyl-CoA mutase